MILKGSQRGGGADLAIHLMNSLDNERVEIAEVYGAVAGDLYGAFSEFEAVSLGTKAKEYLYSLSINPPAQLTREQYNDCIGAIEQKLGLSDQPRAVVFHIKDGREHCHVVWSRIDVEAMKAIHMGHDRSKLMDVACELARKYDLAMPHGLKAWEAKEQFKKEQLEATLAERAQQQSSGITAEERRAEITAAYEQSDTPEAFRAALEQKGYVLARGDRRGFVVVDGESNVHSLTRYLKGHKSKEIGARLSALQKEQLPGVDQARTMMHARAQAAKDARRKSDDTRERLAAQRQAMREALSRKQAQRRTELTKVEQELLTRQQPERLSMHAAQALDANTVLFRVRSAVADLIGRTPGLRSVLGPIQKLTHLDPRDRHALEREALARRHEREASDIERQKRFLSHIEKRESRSLEVKLTRADSQAHELDGKAKQDFAHAARDRQSKTTNMEEGDLSVSFNDAGEFVEGAHRDGEEDGGPHRKGWKRRSEKHEASRKRSRSKGYGFGRKGD